MIRFLFALAALVGCLFAPSGALAGEPLTLYHDAPGFTAEIRGELEGGLFVNVDVVAVRPDGSPVAGGGCVGRDGDRCLGPLTDALNHIYPTGAAEAPAVDFYSPSGSVHMVCIRVDGETLSGLVSECSTAGTQGSGGQCGAAGGRLGDCVADAAGARRPFGVFLIRSLYTQFPPDETRARHWDTMPLERWIRWLASVCMLPTALMPLS